MSLNETVTAGVAKKVDLISQDWGRFATRATLAGAYLTLGTAFAGVVGQAVNQVAPGLGGVAFALFFGLGLFCIVILNAELATGDMMFMIFGAVRRQISWGRAFAVIGVATLFNLVGAVAVAAVLGCSAKLSGMGADHLIYTLTEGKLGKSPVQLLVEGIGANFVVNMGIVGALFAKDIVSKFVVLVPVIAIFVGLGFEHVIANFSLVTTTLFAADSLSSPVDAAHILTNWALVWVGNVLGGGFLIGGVYAWLNAGPEAYRD
ncbi:formate/nitrite transporter family protein [Corynebacterium uberis]|uniref:formate/nitrite transporter family protein n=1 Tax=Corynebacterium TaxID=1716 RepID=UPI001D0B41BD|nr:MULTISPECIES: formate/nitrite transporter family protein [Corynebacterium]MCZ9309392.1 formate/nitrite transporter family protein [Corynebacterium sp. c6VSa_13]UDL72941.1 formate/nitrite transporter family protein [Corynebacterium uberis]UDL76182.1 formate/nitrite transporter family protein [Corynebacterium uberis]UDL78394.1 formate/nitrite transporter family protein [Corynebacterium uberis]UDL80677.1 formate/nitrite transporter family protein [Corynebacterium uberis]